MPVKSFSIEDKAEKEGFADDRENMKEGAAAAEGVVEADFLDRVETALPEKPFGVNFRLDTVKGEADRDWLVEFGDHTRILNEYCDLFINRRKNEVKREKGLTLDYYRILCIIQVYG